MDAFLQLTVGKDNVWTTETAQLSVDTVAIFVANDVSPPVHKGDDSRQYCISLIYAVY